MSSTSTQAPKVLAPPQIACGYHINMPYLQGFLKRTPADEVEQGLAVLAVVGWWLDLPLDQRRSAPRPYKLIPKDSTSPNDHDVILVTRIETLRTPQDVEDKLQELDADRAKCAKFIEGICAAEEKQVDELDRMQISFEMKRWTPEQIKRHFTYT
ncbi:hypothetical protein NLJ89_g11732 [Agrocybe chaxingu]|uniref:Uncharacterized protein n=1 Tax=Agrocybe chaxingu TaxID=84603 RepID=A0A9W8JN69_9AGAR|nr:hypothetical protein NLJ89_g11732 [Agrocybe chaxingu]